MEYLSGGSLKERMKKLGPLPDRRATAVALQVARALRFAHDNGVIHGDLKPGDVLITEAGDVKVKDFGIARSTSSKTDTVDTRRSDPYLAPERADGGEATREGDLYSLGVILHEMLTGEPPHNDEPPAGSPNGYENDGAVNPIVATLISQSPDDRYADSDQLIKDLGRASAGIEIGNAGTGTSLQAMSQESGVPRRAELRRGRGRRQPLLLALSLLAVLLVAGLAWAGFGFLQTSTQEQQSGGQQPEARQESKPEPKPKSEPKPKPEPKPVMLSVPNLEGMTLEEARGQVGEDFDLVQDGQENSSRPQGTILNQKPSGGQAEKGSKIKATVASGRNEVPAVATSTLEEARNILFEAGFEPTVLEAESTAASEGLVLSQNPAYSETADLGSQVEVVVGTGPAPVEVPSLYGYTPDEAAAQLQNLGLVFGGSDTAPSDEVTKGGVIAQSVAPGVSVEPGVAGGCHRKLRPEDDLGP